MSFTNNYEKNMLRDVLEELRRNWKNFLSITFMFSWNKQENQNLLFSDVYRMISATAQFLPPNPATMLRCQSSLKHLERQDTISSKDVHR